MTTQDRAGDAHPMGWLEKGTVLFFVLFLVAFPKGGIKIADVPLTWGYLGLAAFFGWFLLGLLARRPAAVGANRLVMLAALIPFQLTIWLALVVNGIDGFGFAISLVVSFFFVPLAFVLAFGSGIDRISLPYLFGLLRVSILAVAVYGIFLFFYKLLTGSFVEIPYLTVNAGDLGTLEDNHIDRGGIFKLISTYNNGNIYGICILMLLPLYSYLEPRVSRQLVVKASLLLTLSRTVWAGLIVFELLHRLYVRRASVRTLGVLVVSVALIATGVWFALDLLGVDAAFLLDSQLGGRIEQLWALQDATVLPSGPFREILEIVYLSVLTNFGVVGLAAFLLAMVTPVAMHALGTVPHAGTPYKRALATGLIVYLIVAASDGAMLFIPTMAFFWGLVSLLLSPNPSFAEAAPRDERRAPAQARPSGGRALAATGDAA